MKTKLPALAAALLLASSPTLADDLLDAVLWDGPSSFPSASVPANEPPPAVEPAPAPLPAAPAARTVPLQSVPSADTPALRSSAYDPVFAGPSEPQVSAPQPAPAPSDAEAFPGETQIRREIEEMRARADRLEAALGPAAAQKPLPPQYDRADWPKRARLSVGGALTIGDNEGGGYAGEFAFPVAETSFDVALRGYYLEDDPDKKIGYISSRRRSLVTADKEVMGATVWGVWYPLRGALVSPYAGVGIGYEKTSGAKNCYEGQRDSWYYYYYYDRIDHKRYDDSGLTLAGRAGATLTWLRLTLKGEIIITSESKTYLAEVGLRIWEHLVLNGLVERFDVDLSDSVDAFGGGLTFLF